MTDILVSKSDFCYLCSKQTTGWYVKVNSMFPSTHSMMYPVCNDCRYNHSDLAEAFYSSDEIKVLEIMET